MSMIRTLRSELYKLVTSLPMLLVFAGAIICPILLALATGLNATTGHAAVQVAAQDQGFEVTGFGQPLVILLAALAISDEYDDGQIRTSLAATPSRPRFLAAKMIVVAGAAALIGLIATPVSALMEQWTRNHQSGRDAGLVFTARMALNVGTVALNYILIALIAFAFTAITRSIVATLVVMIPMVLGLTIGLVPALPMLKYLPDLAGIQLLTHYPGVPLLAPLPGALVMTAWAAILTAASTMLFATRDVEK